ncbi:galactose-3-O-sulfotransferase 2-like [Centruroides sculpturatus]|uniref:galactose-3-O-sulfotransferase 2-like n=1 Tax=Centruroides sculpturatus TaxID=218467 RepID=UPI000C6CEC52|nr:galactose-3-O-sulfotransferase 2-like [Centruroides sculpturatus]
MLYVPRLHTLQWTTLILITVVCLMSYVWFNWDSVIASERKYANLSVDQLTSQCSPRKNVVFLKTHKCASSSIQNIFLRYTDKHNLTLVLPLFSSTNYLSSTKPFNRSMIGRVPWSSFGYNILCHHMVFNYPEVKALMPSDTIYVSIIRNPVSVFESLYVYGNLKDFFNMSLQEYIKNTKNLSMIDTLKRRLGGNLGYNQIIYDFGMSPSNFDKADVINKTITNIEKTFDLVMIAEMFDESLILLKNLMCWNFDDVVSFAINVRQDIYKTQLNESEKVLLDEWNSVDRQLYDHFLEIFKKKLQFVNQNKLKDDVQQLKKRRQLWYKRCVKEIVNAEQTNKNESWNKMVHAYKLKDEAKFSSMCQNLVKSEIQYTKELRKKQLLRSIKDKDTFEVEEMFSELGIEFPDMINVGKKDLKNVMLALSEIYQHKDDGFLPVQVRGSQ